VKTIIAGSRDITDFAVIEQAAYESGFHITEVVSGTARGVDKLGEGWASMNEVPIKRFPAQWELYGRGAGIKRNAAMAEYADALIAVWDGSSRGTKHMIDYAEGIGLRVYIFIPEYVE